MNEVDLLQCDTGASQPRASLVLHAGIVDEELDPLIGVKGADNQRVRRANFIEQAIGPGDAVVRPGEPDGLLRLPFGWHAKTKASGRRLPHRTRSEHGPVRRLSKNLQPSCETRIRFRSTAATSTSSPEED